MTTIGTATLQIIPSLLGVTEAIEKQLDGKAINVEVAPKVDRKATEAAGKQAKAEIEKQTTQVKVEPKVDTKAAEKAGKSAGDAVTKGAKDAVEKSDTGSIAEVLIDGIADGVKDELRGGPLVDVFVDGLAEGVKQGIDDPDVGRSIISSITDAVKSGDIGGKIKDAVLPGITGIGDTIKGGAADWSRSIGDLLRSGGISDAAEGVKGIILSTTTDAIREITGVQGALNSVDVGPVQTGLQTISDVLSGFDANGDSGLERALGKIGGHAGQLSGMVGSVSTLISVLNDPKTEEALNKIPGIGVAKEALAEKPAEAGRSTREWIQDNLGITLPDLSQWEGFKDDEGRTYTGGGGTFGTGGYTGPLPVDKIAGVVHGGEFVVKASSQTSIENAYPGLLDFMNNTGRLPGYDGGGRVAYGLPTGTDTGGYGSGGAVFPEWVHQIEKRFGVKASTYAGHQEKSGLNKGIDWVGSVDAMQGFAEYLASIRGQLEQVIWMNPNTGQKIGVADGQLVGPGTSQPGYYSKDWGAHQNHVHTRQSFSFGGSAPTSGIGSAVSSGIDLSTLIDTTSAAPTPPVSAVSATSDSSGGFTLPSSISGLATLPFDNMVSNADNREGHRDPAAYFPKAASAAIGGQISSALGVFGVPDSPGWLQGIPKFVSGISIGGGPGGGSAAPAAASAPTSVSAPPLPAGNVHGGTGRQPGPVFNTTISAFDTTDAMTLWQRKQNEIVASKVGVYG